jgi:hypothetical protein
LTTGLQHLHRQQGVDTDSHTIRIGDSDFQTATFIAGIYGTPIVGGAPVVINSNGQLGIAAIASSTPSAPSSRRFKQEILRYEAMNTKLRGEFLKQHRTVQELKKGIAALTATVKEQAAQIQKVSQLQRQTAPQMVGKQNNAVDSAAAHGRSAFSLWVTGHGPVATASDVL